MQHFPIVPDRSVLGIRMNHPQLPVIREVLLSESTGNIIFNNPLTGEIDLSASVVGGPFDVTYTVIGGCQEIQAITILPNSAPVFFLLVHYRSQPLTIRVHVILPLSMPCQQRQMIVER